MASEATDLIREAIEAFAGDFCVCTDEEYTFGLIRRLRDALEASEAELAENEAFINVWRNRTYRAEAALAEANTTIERIEALADEWQGAAIEGPWSSDYAAVIRRALKGEQS